MNRKQSDMRLKKLHREQERQRELAKERERARLAREAEQRRIRELAERQRQFDAACEQVWTDYLQEVDRMILQRANTPKNLPDVVW